MFRQMLDMREDPHDKRSRCSGIFQCNVVSDCVKIRVMRMGSLSRSMSARSSVACRLRVVTSSVRMQ